MKRMLVALLAVIGCCGVLAAGIMVGMAIRFGEWGRVFVYALLLLLSLEVTGLFMGKIRKHKKKEGTP